MSAPEQRVAEGTSHEHTPGHEHLHAFIGVSLVLGFVFMLLVDQIGSSHMHSSDGQCISVCLIELDFSVVIYIYIFFSAAADPEAARAASSKITTTLGLVVHAAGNEMGSYAFVVCTLPRLHHLHTVKGMSIYFWPHSVYAQSTPVVHVCSEGCWFSSHFGSVIWVSISPP